MAAIPGTTDNDTLNGTPEDDQIEGFEGNDTITGGGGNDVISGGEGIDSISGGDGFDTFYLTTTDTVDGGDGDDEFWFLSNEETPQTVVITGSGLKGGTGRDRLFADPQIVSRLVLGSFNAGAQSFESVEATELAGTDSGDDIIDLSALGEDGIAVQAIFGQGGDDTLIGSQLADVLAGDAGIDALRGQGGNDILIADWEDSSIEGGAGNDRIALNSSALEDRDLSQVTLRGGDGTDRLDAGIWDRTQSRIERLGDLTLGSFDAAEASIEAIRARDLRGTEDADRLSLSGLAAGSAQIRRLLGLGGDDLLAGSDGGEFINGQDGADEILAGGGNDRVVVGRGDVRILGGAGDDRFTLASGEAVSRTLIGVEIRGGQGRDSLIAGVGSVTGPEVTAIGRLTIGSFNPGFLSIEVVRATSLEGSAGDDSIFLANLAAADAKTGPVLGLDGDDQLTGSKGNDILNGGLGDDLLVSDLPASGIDTLIGGAGDDTYIINSTKHQLTGETSGRDTVITKVSFSLGTAAVEVLFLQGKAANGFGNGLGNTIIGNERNNTLDGNAGADLLNGELGDDVLDGGNGDDDLRGEGGADVLIGGIGDDTLNGGAGKDVLTGGTGSDRFLQTSLTGPDVVKDFSKGVDLLLLDLPGLLAGPVAPRFAYVTEALTPTDRILYRQVTGEVLFDADGSGNATPQLLFNLSDGLLLTPEDLRIV